MKKILLTLILFSSVLFAQSEDEFSLAKVDTTGIITDTLSRWLITATSNSMNDTCKRYQLMITVDDTIQISSSASFPANNLFIFLPSMSILDWTWYSVFNSNLYWKVSGTGNPKVYIKLKAWGKQ